MRIDLTITITVILALSAIISPIIVAIINNRFQIKMKQLENYDLAKRDALDNFAEALGKYKASVTFKDEELFFSSLYSLLLYFEIDTTFFTKLVESKDDTEILFSESNKLIIELSKQIKYKWLV